MLWPFSRSSPGLAVTDRISPDAMNVISAPLAGVDSPCVEIEMTISSATLAMISTARSCIKVGVAFGVGVGFGGI